MMCQQIKKMENKKSTYNFILVGLQFSLLLLFVLLKDYDIHAFKDRIIGNSLLEEIDITSRINHYYVVLFLLIPIISIVISNLLNKLFCENEYQVKKNMNAIAILGIIATVIAFIDILDMTNNINFTCLLLCSLNILIIGYRIFFKIINAKFNFEDVKWVLLAAIPIAMICSLIAYKMNLVSKQNENSLLIPYWLGTLVLFIIINLPHCNKNALKKSYVFFLLAPLFDYIYLELYHILNQYNIVIWHKLRIEIAIYAILFGCTMVSYLLNRKKEIQYCFEKCYYPIVLVTVAMMVAALPMAVDISMDHNEPLNFFEGANHGVGVYEFFRFGKLPIVENFDAHMMAREIWGIVYGIINHDILGAVFCLYEVYIDVIFMLLFYYLLKKFTSKDVAFLTALFFPLKLDVGLINFQMAILAILALINAYQKQNMKSYLLFWLSLALMCIYQLDIGFSIALATVLVLVYLLIIDRKKNKNIKNVFFPFVGVCVSVLVAFVLLCIWKNVNPIKRIVEFLKLSMSNVNWAFGDLGQENKIGFFVFYIILPLATVGTLIYEAFYCKSTSRTVKIILLSLGLFDIFNFQRALVRHSLFDKYYKILWSFSLIYFSIFIATHMKRKTRNNFIIVYGIFIGLSIVITENANLKYYSNLEYAVDKHLSFEIQDEAYSQKTSRVKNMGKLKKDYANLENVLNFILTENETYIDLTNQTLLYALLGREKPVYVNQSPGLLSGEKTQEFFIEEIENCKKDVPIVLKAPAKVISNELDGIKNDYRYYLIGEYAYQRYTPICMVDGYEIWVINNRYDDIKSKLEQMQNDTLEIFTTEQYINQEQEVMNLGDIARIWGEYDETGLGYSNQINLAEDLEINNTQQQVSIDVSNLDKANGNYLEFNIQSNDDAVLLIHLCDDTNKLNTYRMAVKQGVHHYKIRVSSLYEWYVATINNIKFYSDKNLNIQMITLSEANEMVN